MENFVGNIFFFGSLEDGFKVYPDLGVITSAYSSYYTNTETDWILVVKKSGNITAYTFVKYELLTSVTNGRPGSCLGISIDFIDYYFQDLELLRNQVMRKIWDTLIAENILLELHETSGKVAFKPYNLNEVGPYLDAKSQTIRKVITENHFKNVELSDHIPDAGANPVYSLHPQSAPVVIREIFETYGVVKLSPRSQIETKSVAQKAEEKIRALEGKVDSLDKQLRRRNEEIEELRRRLDGAKEAPSYDHPLAGSIEPEVVARASTQKISPKPDQRSVEPAGKAGNKKAVMAILVCILAAMVFFMLRNLVSPNDVDTKESDNSNTGRPARQPSHQPDANEVSPIREDGGQGFLIAETFLRDNRGELIPSKDGFKDLLTSYLLKNTEVRRIYQSDKNRLWEKIIELNPNRERAIMNFLDRYPSFSIEVNNPYQKGLLDNLIIYSKER